MARTCTICTHAQRAQIEKAIIENASLRTISRQFGISKDAPRRHKTHIRAALNKLPESVQIARGNGLARKVEARLESLTQLASLARQKRDIRASVAAVAAYFKGVELLAKLTGELNERSQHLHLHQHLNVPEETLTAAAEAYLATRLPKTLPPGQVQVIEKALADSEDKALP